MMNERLWMGLYEIKYVKRLFYEDVNNSNVDGGSVCGRLYGANRYMKDCVSSRDDWVTDNKILYYNGNN